MTDENKPVHMPLIDPPLGDQPMREMTVAEWLPSVLERAVREKEAAGRSEKGRQLAIAVTHLETALLWFRAAE